MIYRIIDELGNIRGEFHSFEAAVAYRKEVLEHSYTDFFHIVSISND